GVEQVCADLATGERAAKSIERAVAGCDVVFHVAAKAGVWGSFREYYDANVTPQTYLMGFGGAHGVTRFVYTSSPSVVFDGRDENGIDESVPYPSGRYL